MAFSFGLSSSAEKPKFPAFSTWSMKKNRDDRFGSKESWDEQRLKTGMAGLLSTVFVLDAASEEYYVGVRKDIDSAWDVDLTRPIHFACTPAISQNRYYSDEPSYLLKGLLQLGADPDVYDTHGFTVCCRIATNPAGWSSSSAEIIMKCRPDLELVPPNQMMAKNQLDFALSRAASARHPENTQILEIAEIWRKKMRYGFPSLAKLAHDKDWWAVHNLCRRKVVSAAETHKVYKGKTALEWAEAHGQDKLADELVYLLEIETEDDESDHEGSNQQGTHAEVMREVLSKTNEDVEELKKKIASLEAENKTVNDGVKKEVDLLKYENVALKKRIEELEEASKVQTAKLAKLRENVTLAVGALQFDQ